MNIAEKVNQKPEQEFAMKYICPECGLTQETGHGILLQHVLHATVFCPNCDKLVDALNIISKRPYLIADDNNLVKEGAASSFYFAEEELLFERLDNHQSIDDIEEITELDLDDFSDVE